MKKANNNFLLGVISGVAIVSLTGFLMMTAAYYRKSMELVQISREKGGQNQNEQIDNKQVRRRPNEIVTDLKVAKGDSIRGDVNAPVTIIEYSDLECPFCASFHDTMNQVVKDYKDVRWVFKHYPLPIHPTARKAALASECAGEQGKFWEFTDEFYANQNRTTDELLDRIADKLKLDNKKFNQCLTSEKYASKVDGDIAEGQGLGVSGTPTSYVNGEQLVGAYPYSEVKKVIDQKLIK